MDLEYKMKDSLASSKSQVVRVEFDPPLLGYEEVKPRLLGMKADADEALGTVREIHPFASLPQLIHHPLFKKKNVSTGQGPTDHALRAAVPDLDHHVPPTPPNLCLEHAAGPTRLVLVAGTHPASRDLSGLDDSPHLGVRLYRALCGGSVRSLPRAQT